METYLQVILSIALLIILFVIGFTVFNYEYLKSLTVGGRVRERVVIFKGIHDASVGKDITFDTVNQSASLYRRLSPSYNQMSGAEMTYNFWLYLDPVELYKNKELSTSTYTDEGIDYKNIETQTILFVKGSKKLSNYDTICASRNQGTRLTKKNDIYIKCPLVKLEGKGKYLTVEFNTVQNPEAITAGAGDNCASSNWETANAHKLTLKTLDDSRFAKKWNMITVILQDTYPKDAIPFRNKVRCKIYINTKLELDKYVDGSIQPSTEDFTILKPNLGHLYFTPLISVTNKDVPTAPPKTVSLPEKSDHLMIAHLTYFNYAISQGEIDAEFGKGVGKEYASFMNETKKHDIASKAKTRNYRTLTE